MSVISDLKILHIVNDAATASSLRAADVPGDVLVWQDALYEGPVAAFKDIDKLAKTRAKYFAARGYGTYIDIENAYLKRNEQLRKFKDYSEVVLWFDHDLFGQLQFVQLVSWFNGVDSNSTEISHIHLEYLTTGRVTPRLPQLSESQVLRMFNSRTELTVQQANICQAAWNAFTAPAPHLLTSFYPRDMSTLPFLKNAFARLAKEYPAKDTGLSRTQYLIVDAVKNKNFSEDDIFNYVQRKEPVAFISKVIFHHHFESLLNAQYPLLQKVVLAEEKALETAGYESEPIENTVVKDYSIRFTKYTNQVLNKWSDWVQLNGINRWIGGVHLAEGSIWRYDFVTRRLNKTYV